MNSFSEFLLVVIASSAGTGGLLVLAGYLARFQLAHWLSKDLEATKNQYARELETYRVSLIAAAEKAKAGQAVKTAAALRVIEKKYTAIDELHSCVVPHFALVCFFLDCHGLEKRRLSMGDVNTSISNLSSAIRNASMFLSAEELVRLMDYNKVVTEAVKVGWEYPADVLPASLVEREVDKIMLSQITALEIVERHVKAMMNMD